MSGVRVLTWEYESGAEQHQYVLREGDGVISRLTIEHQKDYDARVEIGSEQLFIEKHLTMPYHLVVRRGGEQIARFEADMKAEGRLIFPDGGVLTWEHPNVLVPEWKFVSAGQSIVDVKAQFDLKRPHGIATIEQSNAVGIELLATLGYYIIVITNLYPSYLFSR